jgi:hypothetical protein
LEGGGDPDDEHPILPFHDVFSPIYFSRSILVP